MSRFVQVSDFEKGRLKILFDQFTEADLQSCIDEVEVKLLRDMLGCSLYDALIADFDADIAGEFSDERFQAIYDPFCFENHFCLTVDSDGIKVMLANVIYFTYLKDYEVRVTDTGFEKIKNDNAEKSTGIAKQIFTRYNEGIKTYLAIQKYILFSESQYDYTDFKGKPKELASWL